MRLGTTAMVTLYLLKSLFAHKTGPEKSPEYRGRAKASCSKHLSLIRHFASKMSLDWGSCFQPGPFGRQPVKGCKNEVISSMLHDYIEDPVEDARVLYNIAQIGEFISVGLLDRRICLIIPSSMDFLHGLAP